MRYIVYDLETERPALRKGETAEWGVTYAARFDPAEMGISVLAAFDSLEETYHVFLEDNLHEFLELAWSADLLVGFNNKRFDNPALSARGVHLDDFKCYDLLQEIRNARDGQFAGHGLGAMCERNFNEPKSADGAAAPINWQKGLHGQVINYCLRDVHLTRRLFERIFDGPLVSPVDNSAIYMSHPEGW
jgi:hypothetical protein